MCRAHRGPTLGGGNVQGSGWAEVMCLLQAFCEVDCQEESGASPLLLAVCSRNLQASSDLNTVAGPKKHAQYFAAIVCLLLLWLAVVLVAGKLYTGFPGDSAIIAKKLGARTL